jgi:hypothetical protein
MLITGASLTIISKLLHTAVTRTRERATSNHDEALAISDVLDDLFDLHLHEREFAVSARDVVEAEAIE